MHDKVMLSLAVAGMEIVNAESEPRPQVVQGALTQLNRCDTATSTTGPYVAVQREIFVPLQVMSIEFATGRELAEKTAQVIKGDKMDFG